MKFNQGLRNRLCLTGPFNSECYINTQEIIFYGYEKFQKEINEKVKYLDKINYWFFDNCKHRKNQLSFDVDNYQGQSYIPRYFMGVEVLLNDKITEEIHTICSKINPCFKLHFEKAVLKYYDTGVGTFSFDASYIATENISYLDLKAFHENLSSELAKVGNKIVDDIKEAVLSKINKANIKIGSEKSFISWFHRIYFFKTDKKSISKYEKIISELIPEFERDKVQNYAIQKDLYFYPSIGSSLVIFTDPDMISNNQFFALENSIEFLNSSWLSVIRIDKYLFYQINELGRNNDRLKLKELEHRYDAINEINEEITLYQSILFNYRVNLSPQEYILWDTIFSMWKLDDLLDGISAKLEILKSMNKSILERVINKQNNKLNYLVFVFTLISFITIILQIIDFVQQGLNVPNMIRTSTVIGLTIVLVFSVKKLRNWLFG